MYSWPSRATGYGYAYDLDSMLFARDGLEQTIRELKAMGVKRVILVAHSMGGALSMEMMRQTELQEPGWAKRNIEGVVLISPDLDLDLFRSQMKRIDDPPDPFIVMVSQKDKILNISARLRGTDEGQRLGNISSVDSLEEFPISVIDTTAFNSDAAVLAFRRRDLSGFVVDPQLVAARQQYVSGGKTGRPLIFWCHPASAIQMAPPKLF